MARQNVAIQRRSDNKELGGQRTKTYALHQLGDLQLEHSLVLAQGGEFVGQQVVFGLQVVGALAELV